MTDSRTTDSRATHRVPRTHTLTSALGLGPMPFTKIVGSHALVGEATRIGAACHPSELTNAEDDLRRSAESKADERLQAAVAKKVEPLIGTIKGLHAEANFVLHQAEALAKRHYVGPHGQTLTTSQAEEEHGRLLSVVADDERVGSRKHHRARRGPLPVLLALDILIMTFLLMRYLNVDFLSFWATPGGLVKAAVAVVFGVLGTVGVVMVTKTFGRRHRPYRGAHGGWDFRAGARTMLVVELGVAIATVLALAGAMAWRFVLDGRGSDLVLTVVMAALFALVTGSIAYLSYQSEFADGSTTTEAIDALAGQLHATSQTRQALAGRLEILVQQSDRLLAQLRRDIETIRITAERSVRESSHDRAIRYARSIHQRAGHGGALPEPRLSLTSLELALEQAARLSEVQRSLDVQTGGGDLAVVA